MAIGNVRLPLGASRDDLAREVGRRIEERLKTLDMSQAELARAVGTSRDSANKWVHGRSVPRRPMLAKIARAVGCEEDDLLPATAQERSDVTEPDFTLQFIGGGRCRVRMDRVLPVSIGTKIADMVGNSGIQQG